MSTIVSKSTKTLVVNSANQQTVGKSLRDSGVKFSFARGEANCPQDIRVGSEFNFLVPDSYRIKHTEKSVSQTTGAVIPEAYRLEFKANYESVESDTPVLGYFAPKIPDEIVTMLENGSFIGATIRFKAALYQGTKFVAPIAEAQEVTLQPQTGQGVQFSPDQQLKLGALNPAQRQKFDMAFAMSPNFDVALQLAMQ